MKRCSRCEKEKELSEFNKDKKNKTGHSCYCRQCDNEKTRAWAKENVERKRKTDRTHSRRQVMDGRQARYDRSLSGVIRSLVSLHGLTRDVARHWATILTCPTTRCALCGIPNQILAVYTREGPHWILGKSHRLTLDHITPGVNDGDYRPLCYACNTTRGAARLTDEEVLNTVRDKWQWSIGLRFLFWMNRSPGVGGRLNRSESCAKRDAQFAEGTILDPPPPTSTEESR
jgi:hypothetical protein